MTTVSSVKLRNALVRLDPTLTVALRNVRVNGVLFGCTGFITHSNGRTVYVSTDHNHNTVREAMYRTAESTRDYTGGRNRWAPMDPEALARAVIALLISEEIRVSEAPLFEAIDPVTLLSAREAEALEAALDAPAKVIDPLVELLKRTR